MNLSLQAFLAFAPILLALVLLIGFRWPAKFTMPLVLLVTVFIAHVCWGMNALRIVASSLQGLFITADILYIIFGAILLLSVLRNSGGLDSIRANFMDSSSDRRVQIIVIGWLFGSFIEGASGFGTPAAIVGPLLLALGFPAFSAVIIGMMVQCTAVTFGAIGTPVLVGLHNGLAASISDPAGKQAFLQAATSQIVLIHALVGTFIPWFMIIMTILLFGRKDERRKAFTIAPFAIFAGLAFTVPYTLTGIFLGPEFPSLLGAFCGLIIVNMAIRARFLLPRDTWDFPGRQDWPASWSGQVQVSTESPGRPVMHLFRAWSPYIIVSALLIISRQQSLGVGSFLKSFPVKWTNILGTGISAQSVPLYLPGTILILAAIATYFIHKMQWAKFQSAVKESFAVAFPAGFVLLFTIPFVQIYINSMVNEMNFQSMPIALAAWTSLQFGSEWPLLAPVIGAMGAFIAGSNTVSNLMFAEFQFNIASLLELSTILIVSLQAVGAAAGNMIAIHNVVAASATVGLIGKEGAILRKTIIPTAYYLVAAGLLGLLLNI